jgi:hypothetical protein
MAKSDRVRVDYMPLPQGQHPSIDRPHGYHGLVCASAWQVATA